MSLVVSILQGGTNSHETSSEEVNFVKTDFFSQGVVGAITNTSGVAPATGAFAVNAQGTPDMTVAVSSGAAYVTGTPTSGNSQLFRVKNSASANVTISSNTTGGTRYDWVYIKLDPDKLKDPASDASDVATLVTSRSTSASTDNGTPPTYGYCIAIVTVANGASSISNSNITDKRARSTTTTSQLGWTPVTDSWSYASYSSPTGTITVPSDATLSYSAGMKVKFTNNGSTQYGFITKVASTTLTVYFGTDYSLTNSTISSIYVSYQKAPFGFPLDPTKWTVTTTFTADAAKSSPTANTWYGDTGLSATGPNISLPIGAWNVEYSTNLDVRAEAASSVSAGVSLSTSSSSESDSTWSRYLVANALPSPGRISTLYFVNGRIVTTSATTYYLIVRTLQSSMSSVGLRPSAPAGFTASATNYLRAVCAYL